MRRLVEMIESGYGLDEGEDGIVQDGQTIVFAFRLSESEPLLKRARRSNRGPFPPHSVPVQPSPHRVSDACCQEYEGRDFALHQEFSLEDPKENQRVQDEKQAAQKVDAADHDQPQV